MPIFRLILGIFGFFKTREGPLGTPNQYFLLCMCSPNCYLPIPCQLSLKQLRFEWLYCTMLKNHGQKSNLHMIITALSKKPVASVKLVLREKKDLLKIGTVKRKPLEVESKIFECYYMEPTGLLILANLPGSCKNLISIFKSNLADFGRSRVSRWSEVNTDSEKVAHWGAGGVYQISNLKFKK
jgi:ribosomal protein L29